MLQRSKCSDIGQAPEISESFNTYNSNNYNIYIVFFRTKEARYLRYRILIISVDQFFKKHSLF